MSVIKITEVFIGCINNNLERRLQSLMASCIQGMFDNSKICEFTSQGYTVGSDGKEWPQPTPKIMKKMCLWSQMEINIRSLMLFAGLKLAE